VERALRGAGIGGDTVTRTFTDHLKQTHTLDLDQMLVDGLPCLSVQSDGQYVQFETVQGAAITCELGQFWREVAGPDLSATEAGLLLADCLVRQVMLQRTSSALHEVMALLTRAAALPAEIPSAAWLTTRLDPLARQAMSAYDGSEAMTEMLARILHQSPATIHQWAQQLNLTVVATPAPIAEAPGTVETLAEAEARERFFWSPQHCQQLDEELKTCTASTVAERARQIAARCNWPLATVRNKLYAMQAPRYTGHSAAARESDTAAEAEKEDDQRVERNAVTV
jgi:hypothetical protein